MVEHVDNVSRRMWSVVGLRARRGVAVTLLVRELRTCNLEEVVCPPSALPDKGLMEVLERHDDATSRIVHRRSVDEVVRDTPDPGL